MSVSLAHFRWLLLLPLLFVACNPAPPTLPPEVSTATEAAPTPQATPLRVTLPAPTPMPSAVPTIWVGTTDTLFCPTANIAAQQAFIAANDNHLRKPAEAEQLYLQALALDPDFCDAMDNLGQLLRQQGRLDEAIAWYQRSLAVFPTNPVALQNMGMTYKLQGEPEAALATYTTLTEVDPNNPEGYFGLGTLYFAQQKLDLAIEHLTRAAELYAASNSPYIVDAQYYLGYAYFMQENCEAAQEHLVPIYDHFAEDDYLNYMLGVCYVLAEPPAMDLARQYLTKAQALGVVLPPDLQDLLEAKP